MDIGSVHGAGGPERIEGIHGAGKNLPLDRTDASSAPVDRVEFSEHARMVSEVLSLPSVRADRIEAMQQLIQSGRFEAESSLEGAIEKFLAENIDLLA